ncbi:MAG: acetyl-CoA carboxylase biotin carboxylase subunit family protein [Gemmiger sp.]
MNVLFISPHFPRHFYQFCQRLKSRGANVLGIGDCPWEGIGDACRNALTDYRAVPSLQDYDAVYHAAADFIFHYGRIDFVESQNEYWLELDARLRTDFNITTGPKSDALAAMNHKSLMKQAYQRAGVPAARWTLPRTLEQAQRFAGQVGYPVILKPDHGMGAADTHKLDDDGALAAFWQTRDGGVDYIEEECVPGHVETFDGVTDSRKNVLFCASQVLPRSLMDAAHGDDIVSYCQAVPADLRDAGERVLRQFDTRNRFFHFEFFRLDQDKPGLGQKGDIVGLEVNMRAPGGRIPDKMNYAFDTDVYTIWADSLLHDRCYMNSEFRHLITHVGRRRAIAYRHSDEEIRARFAGQIIEDFDVDPALAADMGDHAFLLRADSRAEWQEQMDFLLSRQPGGNRKEG